MGKKVRIAIDERYPDYYLDEPFGWEDPWEVFEFSDEDYEDYLRVRREYAQWQDRLAMRGRR